MASEFFDTRKTQESSVVWLLEPHDICYLKTWPEEYAQIVAILDNYTRLPNVLEQIVISYVGSIYADALVKLGKTSEFYNNICKCKRSGQRSGRKYVRIIMTMLANAIGIEAPHHKYKYEPIKKMISNMTLPETIDKRYGDDLKRCAIFHKIILSYF